MRANARFWHICDVPTELGTSASESIAEVGLLGCKDRF
jgi:hypothetical protein